MPGGNDMDSQVKCVECGKMHNRDLWVAGPHGGYYCDHACYERMLRRVHGNPSPLWAKAWAWVKS